MSAAHLDRRRQVIVLAVVLALIAVGGVAAVVVDNVGKHRGSTPDVVQLPSPTAPATTGSATTAPAQQLRWTSCGNAQCATLTVPMDWSGTDAAAKGRTVPLALIRYAATGGAKTRIGSLVVNPGGPGASGVDFVRDALTTIPASVRARFDVVGFDPRGTGRSSPVRCQDGKQLDALVALPPYPTTAQQQTQIESANAQEAAACATALGPLLRHLSTLDAARDLDAIRAALGDERITYLGYSYGTYLGAEYAGLFPTHIRALVLDGAIDPSVTGTQQLVGQAGGFEGAFQAFAAWCAGSSSCPFGSNLRSAADVTAAYQRLAAQVAQTPLSGSRPVTSGIFLAGTLVTLYDRKNGWPALGIALQRAQQGSGAVLLQLADQFVGRNSDGSYDPELEANAAVNCLDHAYPDSAAATEELADQLAGLDPVFGRAIAWSGQACRFWKAPVTGKAEPVHAAGAPPILVVATTRDPATPYAGGVALAQQLDDGRLVTFDGDGHTAYRASGSSCVQQSVNAYLLSLTAPPRAGGVRC